MSKPNGTKPKPSPVNVFEMHGLPHIAARIEKLITDITRRKKQPANPVQRSSMRTALQTAQYFVASRPQWDRIEALIESIPKPTKS